MQTDLEAAKGSSVTISLILPAWNESEVIETAIAEADAALRPLAREYEIIVVDDGSTDETAALVRAAAQNNPSVRLVQHSPNQGYGAALRSGFAAASKDLVVFTDADCQFDLTELERFVLLSQRYDIVCGYRIDRKDTALRCLYSNVYNQLVRLLLGTGVRDVDCALKMFHRDIVQHLKISGDGFLVNSEILTQAKHRGHSVVEVGVSHRPRTAGTSTVSIRHIPKVLSSLVRYWWNQSLFPLERHQQIAAHQAWTRRQEIGAAVGLAIACLFVLLPSLSYPLIDPDETRYAQIALEMNATGDWVTPKLDGQAYLDKPPLMYWLTAVSFRVFGNHEIAARLPSVLSALATIGLVFIWGRQLVGGRAAWLGAMLLLLSGGFVLAGRFLILDPLLTLFVVAALLAGYVAVRDPIHDWKWWMLAGVACALGVLTKGPIALLLSVPPLVASGWLRRDQTQIGIRHWIAFGLPTLAICLPWYLAVWKSNPAFGDTFFWEHNLKRFTQGSNHEQPFWFYLPVLFAGMFPTSLLLPALAMFLFSRSDQQRNHRSKDFGFLACGAVWILVFFSLASCKLPTYILPALPLICLMLGDMLDRTVLNANIPSRITTYLKPFPQRANLILVFACLTVLGIQDWFCGEIGIAGCWAAGTTILVLIGTTITWNRSIAFSPIGWTATLVVAVGTVSFAATSFLPAMAAERSVYSKTANLAQQHPEAQIVFFGEHAHAAGFQLPSERIIYFDKQQGEPFAAFLATQPQTIVVTDEQDIQSTRATLSSSHRLRALPIHQHLYLAEPHHPRSSQVAAANHGGLR